MLLIVDLVINAAVVTVEQLLTAVERTTAIVVWKYLEVGVDNVIVAIHIHRRVITYDPIGCSFVKLPLIARGVYWQFVLVRMLI